MATPEAEAMTRATPRRSKLVSLAVVALGLAACSAEPGPSASAGAESNLPGVQSTLPVGIAEDDVLQWTAFRQFWGLRADTAWAISVAQDSTADLSMEVPLLPWELSQIADLDKSAQDLVQRLKNYGSRFPDDFAGVFIDGPNVVARFAHNFESHLSVIGPRFAGTKRVRIEQASYSLPEIERIATQVAGRRSLIDGLGVTFYSSDVDVINNKVRVRYQGDPRLESDVRAVLGNPDWLRLEAYNT